MRRISRDPSAPSHLRRLVESARRDGLDEKRRRRVAERLGLALAVVGPMDAVKVDAPAAAAPWSSVGAIALAMVALAGGSVSYMRVTRSEQAAAPGGPVANSIAAPPVTVTPASPAQADALRATDVSALPDAAPEQIVSRPRAAKTTSLGAKHVASDLRFEIVALDGVRRATESRRPRIALALLDDYAAKYPAGKLREEALVLRIEALHASGDQPAADALARRLLRESPNSPYAARVRAALVDPLRE